jgi:plastocyanin
MLISCCLFSVALQVRGAEVTARLVANALPKGAKLPPAVIWLKPISTNTAVSAKPGIFTLMQKDKMFSPHLLVIPVGSNVLFPNQDPFFHNVFSLFDGKRFDLGLYEAGSSRSVIFSREGVSYIFCNIHSDMSAVIIALSTPYYAVANAQGGFDFNNVPAGDYDLHVWVEGEHENSLEQQTHRVHISKEPTNLGEIHSSAHGHEKHLNKFGQPYGQDPNPPY